MTNKIVIVSSQDKEREAFLIKETKKREIKLLQKMGKSIKNPYEPTTNAEKVKSAEFELMIRGKIAKKRLNARS